MSDSDVMQREQEIFDLARQIESPEVRATYLSQACQDDPELYRRVAELLSIYDAEDSLLDQIPDGVGATIDFPKVEQEGEAIGPYQLLQKIGEGGFGVVFMAEQTEPVRRKVALKIIKPGMDSKEVIARFEAERQALAMMNHPNIASVLDGGCTPAGRPYFVMELVRGVSLTEYCDKKRLQPTERLKLFMDVCAAIQHAHQKGIIHRDIKPSNVMVTPHDGTPVVKVIDFGVAKAINQQLTEKMYFTRYGQMIGTPQYMSPEQAEMSGLGVDTLSDIYSLGVLLYELLVGTTPLKEGDLREVGYKEMQRMICEEEAARPSNRLSTTGQQQLLDIAEHRGVTPEILASEISGDLEWIVMKTLEKERDRRYPTPLDLSRDLQRYLNDQPVDARPPSIRYRLSKYCRRHRVPVAAAAAIALVLLLTSGFSTRMWISAQRAEQTAVENYSKVLDEQEKTQKALGKAENLAKLVSRQNQQLESQLYRTLIQTAADLELGYAHDEARKVLNSCPVDQRDWEYDRLQNLLSSNRVLIKGDQVPLYAGRNDRLVTVAGIEHPTSVCVWNPETGALLDEIQLETKSSLLMSALHPNNRLVATADESGSLYLVDIEKRKTVLSIKDAHDGRVDGLGFSSDGSVFASCSWTGQLKLWTVEAGTLITENRIEDPLRGAEFDPTGRFIATAGRMGENFSGFVRIWDAKTLELIRELKLNGQHFRTVAFSPNGNQVAIGGNVGSTIWNTQTWEVEHNFPHHPGVVTSVRFRPDGKALAASGKGTVRIWEISTRRLAREITTSLNEIWWTNFSPDQKSFAFYGSGPVKGVLIENLDAPVMRSVDHVVTLRGLRDKWVTQGAFSPDGKRFAATGTDRSIMIWNTDTREITEHLHGHRASIGELEWAKDGRLFSSDAGGYVRAWDKSGSLQWENKLDENVLLYCLNTMAIHPDSKRLFCGTSDRGIVVVDSTSGMQTGQIADGVGVTAVACSPDGKWLAATSFAPVIQLYDAATLKHVGTIPGPVGTTKKIVFSPDSRKIAAASRKAIVVADVSTRRKDWSRNIKDIEGLAFSNSGQRLFASFQGVVRVHDSRNGGLIYDWPARDCFDVAFDPVGQTIATVGSSGTVLLFEIGKSDDPATSKGVAQAQPEDIAPKLSPYQMQLESRRILVDREEKEYAQALKLAIDATEQVTDCAEYEFTKGVAYFRDGNFEQANQTLKKVEAMKWNKMIGVDFGTPAGWTTYLHAVRAMTLHKLDRQELANEQLQIAKAMLVSNDEIGRGIIEEADHMLVGKSIK